MALEAPLSRYRKNNLRILIAVLLVCTGWFAYDGFLNKKFIEQHTRQDNTPDSTLTFNRRSPLYFLGGAVLAGAYLYAIRNRKIIATENELVIGDSRKIAYESIEKIDKTHFDSKGYFVVTYRDHGGRSKNCRINDRKYDNLQAILDLLIDKIS